MQQRTLSGSSIEEVLTKAAGICGSSGRIISTPRECRLGGFHGFFTKPGYEMVVELPETAEELVESANRAAVVDGGPLLATSAPETVEEMLRRQAVDTEDVFEVEHATAVVGAGGPALSTRRRPPASFDETLDEVTSSMGREPDAFADLLQRLEAGEDPMEKYRTPMPPRDRHDEEPDPSTMESPAEESDALEPPAPEPLTESTPRARSRARDPEAAAHAVAKKLVDAGFPSGMLVELAADGPQRLTLERAFSMAPAPRSLPTSIGSLIAVVGPGERALELARRIGRELGSTLGPRSVTVAMATPDSAFTGTGISRHRLAIDAKQAMDLSPAWRRDRIGVVAVETGSVIANLSWVREMLQAIEPSYVCMLTRADVRINEVHRRSDLIGGADALFVDSVGESAMPAGILEARVPIGRLDGEACSPKAWAKIIRSLPAA